MITVKELTKRYARNIAVDHISFQVEKGQIVGFLGPNGAGKTTTMRMLTGFLSPTSGSATVAGYDVLEQPLEVKKRIGYLPETPPLYPEMETGEYLTFVGRLKGLSGAELRKRVAVSYTHLDVYKRQVEAEASPAIVKRNAPIEAKYVRARFPHRWQECSAVGTEINYGRASFLQLLHQFGGARQHVTTIVFDAEASDPAVENLNHVRARVHLLRRIFGDHRDQLLHQFIPYGRR